jgi:hypothetical protein
MRTFTPHYYSSVDSKGRPVYVLETRVNSKRHRKFFKTKQEAKAKLKEVLEEWRLRGSSSTITDNDRATVVEYSPQLADFGKSVRDACQHYLSFLKESQVAATFTVNLDKLTRRKPTSPRRGRSIMFEGRHRQTNADGDRPSTKPTITTAREGIAAWMCVYGRPKLIGLLGISLFSKKLGSVGGL